MFNCAYDACQVRYDPNIDRHDIVSNRRAVGELDALVATVEPNRFCMDQPCAGCRGQANEVNLRLLAHVETGD